MRILSALAIGNDRQKKTRAANSGSLSVSEETEILLPPSNDQKINRIRYETQP